MIFSISGRPSYISSFAKLFEVYLGHQAFEKLCLEDQMLSMLPCTCC